MRYIDQPDDFTYRSLHSKALFYLIMRLVWFKDNVATIRTSKVFEDFLLIIPQVNDGTRVCKNLLEADLK